MLPDHLGLAHGEAAGVFKMQAAFPFYDRSCGEVSTDDADW